MGKYKKKELLKTVALMEEANLTISNMEPNYSSAIIDTLIQCQEAALQLGNYLETLNRREDFMISLLEEYCESLYLMSQSLNNRAQYTKYSKVICRQLASIRKKLCDELLDEKWEIVFLPYKASMWDSLESVWRAASQDKQCDVYVIPIPYFDRTPDGMLGEMHYEGNLYPRDVPITSWEIYCVENRHPDIIYIHNPYDQYNYVTSVHPNFYAAELKKHTDMLVYVPYFISTAHHIGKHFCTLPGVFYADKVIVEDKEKRKIYIEEFQKYEKQNDCKEVFGKKMVGAKRLYYITLQ